MALIFYGLSGDGRGHATRAQTVVDQLRTDHRVVVYAPLDAYELLRPYYEGTGVEVRSIPGLRMCYDAKRKVHALRTTARSARYIAGLPGVLRRVRREIDREQPDLVVSDFDPTLPWAAQGTGVPVVSLDHQHVLATSDLSDFPWRLRMYAASVSPVVHAFAGRPVAKIVSSFAFPPANPRHPNVHRVGALLRDDVRLAQPEVGEHLVAYFRRFAPPALLEALAKGPRPVRVYGLGEQPSRGALDFRAIDARAFVEDLASSAALVSTAGNQLVGEALYLHKPIFAVPETGNSEQSINAQLLRGTGAGVTCAAEVFEAPALHTFLDELERYRAVCASLEVEGNTRTMQVLAELLAHPEAPSATAEGSVEGAAA